VWHHSLAILELSELADFSEQLKMRVLAVLLFACVAARGWGELFSSMAHLQSALYAEQDIAKEIRNYISEEQAKLEKLSK